MLLKRGQNHEELRQLIQVIVRETLEELSQEKIASRGPSSGEVSAISQHGIHQSDAREESDSCKLDLEAIGLVNPGRPSSLVIGGLVSEPLCAGVGDDDSRNGCHDEGYGQVAGSGGLPGLPPGKSPFISHRWELVQAAVASDDGGVHVPVRPWEDNSQASVGDDAQPREAFNDVTWLCDSTGRIQYATMPEPRRSEDSAPKPEAGKAVSFKDQSAQWEDHIVGEADASGVGCVPCSSQGVTSSLGAALASGRSHPRGLAQMVHSGVPRYGSSSSSTK